MDKIRKAITFGLLCMTAPAHADSISQKNTCLIEKMQITTSSGEDVVFTVHIADTPERRSNGLMFVWDMPPEHGMLFRFSEPNIVYFWMKNTFIPLDMIFIGDDGVIVHIHENAIPHDENSISSIYPVTSVLEINGGEAASRGVSTGDRVTPLPRTSVNFCE